ncbi:MAG: ABC transporter permease [Eubacterium sp.]|nr:ABC transporter permease [Eubacterium sp.]
MGYIIKLSLANIKLRKLRTILTIVGIMIGVMSIVTMLTTGLSAKKTMIDEVEKVGSTKEIVIFPQSTQRKDRLITDSVLEKIEKQDHIDGVYPVLVASGQEKVGVFVAWENISGVPIEYMNYLNLKEGKVPERNGSRPELLIGNGVRDSLYNSKTWQQMSESVQKDDSLVGKKMDFALDNDYNADSEEMASPSDAEADTQAEYVKLGIVGEVDNEYDYNIYTDIDTLKMYLKRHAVDGKIPGQPLDKNRQPYNVWAYDRAIIRVDSVENVKHVSKVLQEMGFQVANNLETLESVNKTISMVQFILGALGTIAAIVAVIGIVNTMMTAVYDRVREIGLLKMLGSDSDDISFMFLFESALMGFIGGVLGVGLSLLVDIYINKRLVAFMEMPEGTWLMTTPVWLIIGAVVVSVVVAVLAGAFPARWASKIKPLDAIAQ